MKTVLTPLLTLLLAASPAAASAAEAPRLEGVWLFHTYAQVNGAPACSELWSFGSGSEMTVESGEERARHRYRVEASADGVWLVTEQLETNRRPDCGGVVAKGVTPGERRTYLVPMNDGGIETCPPPSRTADGAPVVGPCFGRIVRAEAAG
jgi:hypothetical protein